MSEGLKGWNITRADGDTPSEAVGAFGVLLARQENPVREELYVAAERLLAGTPDHHAVTIISSGHVRDDGTGYFALSVAISRK